MLKLKLHVAILTGEVCHARVRMTQIHDATSRLTFLTGAVVSTYSLTYDAMQGPRATYQVRPSHYIFDIFMCGFRPCVALLDFANPKVPEGDPLLP